MTTEIEKTFFDTFGIEPKKGCTAYDKFTEEEADAICNDKCAECSYLDDVYPKITSDRLLELICTTKGLVITEDCNSVEQLKGGVLKVLITLAQVNDIKQQIQALFEK